MAHEQVNPERTTSERTAEGEWVLEKFDNK